MIKDNHVAVAGGVGPAVARAEAAGVERIICEVDGSTRSSRRSPPAPRNAARQHGAGRCCARQWRWWRAGVPTEASGGVRLDTIARGRGERRDYVSVGRLMQSAPAADIGLDFQIVSYESSRSTSAAPLANSTGPFVTAMGI